MYHWSELRIPIGILYIRIPIGTLKLSWNICEVFAVHNWIYVRKLNQVACLKCLTLVTSLGTLLIIIIRTEYSHYGCFSTLDIISNSDGTLEQVPGSQGRRLAI